MFRKGNYIAMHGLLVSRVCSGILLLSYCMPFLPIALAAFPEYVVIHKLTDNSTSALSTCDKGYWKFLFRKIIVIVEDCNILLEMNIINAYQNNINYLYARGHVLFVCPVILQILQVEGALFFAGGTGDVLALSFPFPLPKELPVWEVTIKYTCKSNNSLNKITCLILASGGKHVARTGCKTKVRKLTS